MEFPEAHRQFITYFINSAKIKVIITDLNIQQHAKHWNSAQDTK